MTYGWRNHIQKAAFCIGLVATTTLSHSPHVLAFGSSTPEDEQVSDFRKAERAVKAKDYAGAVGLLQNVLKQEPNNADALNYLAFSQRNLGQLDDSMRNYNAALLINPKHKGALEYQGELYLMLNNKTAAEANLAKLSEICKSCEEKKTLEAALERFNNKTSSRDAPRTYSMNY